MQGQLEIALNDALMKDVEVVKEEPAAKIIAGVEVETEIVDDEEVTAEVMKDLVEKQIVDVTESRGREGTGNRAAGKQIMSRKIQKWI